MWDWGLIDKSMVDIDFLRSQDLKVHLGRNVCGNSYVNAPLNCQYDTGHDDVNE